MGTTIFSWAQATLMPTERKRLFVGRTVLFRSNAVENQEITHKLYGHLIWCHSTQIYAAYTENRMRQKIHLNTYAYGSQPMPTTNVSPSFIGARSSNLSAIWHWHVCQVDCSTIYLRISNIFHENDIFCVSVFGVFGLVISLVDGNWTLRIMGIQYHPNANIYTIMGISVWLCRISEK